MAKLIEKLVTGLAVVLMTVALVIAVAFYNALFASYLWSWFVVPLGAPPLPIWHMCGLMLLINYALKIGDATSVAANNAKTTEQGRWNKAAATVVAPPMVFLFGYAIRYWLMS